MIILYKQKKDCCGCGACKSICPKSAISMQEDSEGFLYPHIDQSICVKCKLCISVCPIKNELHAERLDIPLVYAVKHKSDEIRMMSSSGGAYTAIAEYILSQNNNPYVENDRGQKYSSICYGACYSENFKVIHKGLKTLIRLNEFRGSKYVQSDMESVFMEIEEELLNGKTVLFSGTPCQVAGLKEYLKKKKINQDNLLLNDIICHGTPSPLLWKENLNFLQKKYKSLIKSYSFRSKEEGWGGYIAKVGFSNGLMKINTQEAGIFTKIFFSHLALRPACYNCKFSNTKRPSDITIGDFWGIGEIMPAFDDEKGVSLFIINTIKGQDIFEHIKENLFYKKSNIIDCANYQHNLKHPTEMPKKRTSFWKDYYDFGFVYIAKKYAGYSFYGRTRHYLKKILLFLGLLDILRKILNRNIKK